MPVLLLLCCLLFTPSALATFRISVPPAFAPDHPIRLLIEQAYQQLQLEVEIIELPPRRSVLEVSSGHIDAELARVEEVGSDYPHLLKVPEPLGLLKIAVLSPSPDLAVSHWEELTAYRVDCIRGFKYSELRLGSHAEYLSHPSLVLERLRLGRSQVAVLPYEIALAIQQQAGHPRLHILVIDQPALYHYLHPRHHKLLEPLSAAIRQLKHQAAQPAGMEESSTVRPAIRPTP